MRVLLVNNCHYRRGGADVVYLNTGELLSRMGHDVSYFSTNSPKNEPTKYSEYFINDVNVLELGFTKQLLSTPRKLYAFEAKRNLGKLIRDTKPDIAHIHLYKLGLTASILPVLRKNRIPVIITLHDYGLLCPRNIMIDGDGNICEKCLYRPFYCVIKRCNRKNIFYSTINYVEYEINNKIFKPQKYFDRIICVSKFNCQKHSMRPKLRDRLVHIYNFSPEIKTNVPDHKKGEYFLYFGRLSDEKGVKTLVKAWKELDPGYKLKIVGEGKQYQELVKEVRDNKEENIDLMGYKTGEELKGIVRNASFVIVPSEWYENNPMTISEAYSMGKPVIGSNVGGIPEILMDKKTGFLFEMRNAGDLVSKINQAFSLTAGEYELLSKNARQFAEDNFSEETHYMQLIKVYTEVIDDFRKHAER